MKTKFFILLFLVLCILISLYCDKKNPVKPTAETVLPDSDYWMMNVDLPRKMLTHTVELNGKIYALGGVTEEQDLITTVYEFDPATNEWNWNGEKRIERMAFSASAVNGKIYIFGGLKTIKGEALSHVEEYDPQTRTCTIISDMPIPRACFSTVVVNRKIYVMGGLRQCGTPAYRTVDVYDPATDDWTENVTAMPTPRYKLTSSVVNGKIYAIGGMSGFNRDNSCVYSTVEVYDPQTGVWTTAADMPTARRDLRSEVLDGKIYVFGGRQYGEGLTTTEMYDPETDTWCTKADMLIGRYYHASSAMNGKIYAVSGVMETQSDVSAIGKPIGEHEDYTR